MSGTNGSVVDLSKFREKKPEMVYQCTNCGDQLFFLLWDEYNKEPILECRGCKKILPMKVEEVELE